MFVVQWFPDALVWGLHCLRFILFGNIWEPNLSSVQDFKRYYKPWIWSSFAAKRLWYGLTMFDIYLSLNRVFVQLSLWEGMIERVVPTRDCLRHFTAASHTLHLKKQSSFLSSFCVVWECTTLALRLVICSQRGEDREGSNMIWSETHETWLDETTISIAVETYRNLSCHPQPLWWLDQLVAVFIAPSFWDGYQRQSHDCLVCLQMEVQTQITKHVHGAAKNSRDRDRCIECMFESTSLISLADFISVLQTSEDAS